MTYFYLFQKKRVLLLLSLFILSLKIVAQKNSLIWHSLHNNDREEAVELVKKLDVDSDIENLILKKIVAMESGEMKSSPNFLSKLIKYKNYENYLFSNWALTYLFGDYVETGFNAVTSEIPHSIDASKIKNSTVRNGLYYIQSITSRGYREKWNQHVRIMSKINAIRNWEYCGVFENLNSSGIDMVYPPEEEVSNQIVFDAQSKGDVKWYLSNESNEIYHFYTNHSEYGAGVHYAQTFINSPKNQRVLLKIGKGGQIRLWLNDVTILENDDKYITELDAYTYEVNLQKGINRILIKSATNSGSPYFVLRLEDLQENPLTDYKVSFKNRIYRKGTIESVNPKQIPHKVETFFKSQIEDVKSDNNLAKFCLFLSYYRNGKIDNAINLLNDWSKEYPKSSLIKSCLIECYTVKGDNTSVKRLQNNIKRKDPNYYLSSILEYEDMDNLMKLDIDAYEKKLKKIGNAVDYSFMKTVTDFLILLRKGNKVEMKNKLDELLQDKSLPTQIKTTFSEFYSRIFKDDETTLKVLKKFNESELNSEIIRYIAYYLKKQNKLEEVIDLYIDVIQKFDYDNNFKYYLITLLHETGQYKRSIPYIEEALNNFPNSYLFTKLKGDVYHQTNKKSKAIEFYELALNRKPSDKKLRKKINDLKNEKNPLKDFELKDPYLFIEKNRNSETTNNYGLTTLLSQMNVLAYKKGGGEFRETIIYEVTSQNGVDILKEYNLGLSGDYVINKSEIVKVNGETVPADRSGSKLVFDNLSVGDVIYLAYEKNYSKYGRFYKDYIFNQDFNSYHPCKKSVYRLLTHDKEVNHIVNNGSLNYKKYKKRNYYVHEWSKDNLPGISILEDYMPAYNDVITRLHISSVDSWNDIASWYSDIVRKQLKLNQTVKETFNEIFPKGYKQLSENERAKHIYYYMMDNLNYSHVSFRQGSYVPQRPSKTIKTKLGDCKDFSSLFLVLAQLADLDARLVLILTSDYAKSQLILPSSEFNHCIVKVNIDGKEQFLELTDKNLPYKSLPVSLIEATALEIPYDSKSNFKSSLFKLSNVSREKSSFKSLTEISLRKEMSDVILTTELYGSIASYYIDMLKNKKGKLLKDAMHQDLINRVGESVKLTDVENINFDRKKGGVSYVTKLNLDLKINKVGDLFTFSIPYFINPYNQSIIELDKRSYPINYLKYENTDYYHEEIIIKLGETDKFEDIPENINSKFKEHEFSLLYSLIKPNELKVSIKANVSFNMISVEDYVEFKKYVKKVLDTRGVLVSFKSNDKKG